MLDQSTALRVGSRLSWVLGQVAVVGLAVFVYFRIRGLTETSGERVEKNTQQVVDFERALGINGEATLQSWVAPSQTLETVANWIYIWGHWPVIVVTMVWLAWHHRVVFLRLRDAMVVSGALGMVVFVGFPVAPPRLAGLGMIDTVTENSQAYRVLQPPGFVNQYAAMPSLHSGWDLLVGMSIVTAASSIGLKLVGVAMPVLMGIAVIATANHYFVDVVAGVVLVLLGHLVALRLERWRARRRAVEP